MLRVFSDTRTVRQTNRQTDRQTNRQTDQQTDGNKDKYIVRQVDVHKDR